MNIEKTNLIVKTTSLVMHIVRDYIEEGDFVVDCTMGNGYDTLALYHAVSPPGSDVRGKVLSLDIQSEALDSTRKLLMEHGIPDPEMEDIHLVQDSHENLKTYIQASEQAPAAILFNLGFMPGHDKSVLTSVRTTLPAIRKAIDLVRINGVVSVTTYSGHPEGAEENMELHKFLRTLPSRKYHVAYINMINQKKTAPAVFLITRKKDSVTKEARVSKRV